MDLQIRIDPPINGRQRIALTGRLDTLTYRELERQLELLGSDVHSLGPVHIQPILVPSGFFREVRIDAKDAA